MTTGMRALHGPVRRDDGYSIVELLVVVGIIGILVAVALPTFLGAQHTSENRKAQADLRNGLAAALTHFSEEGEWDAFDAALAGSIEPSVSWIDGGSPLADQISIQVNSGEELLLVRRSTSGEFFCVAQIAGSPSTRRGSGMAFGDVDTVPECAGGW